MSRTCTVCIHPSKGDIDKSLLAGEPYRGVARQYEASAPSVYPVFAAAINANVYLLFVCVSHLVSPGDDKLHDNRHAIAAAYCDALATDDKQLTANAPLISDGLAVKSWSELAPETHAA